MKEPENDDSDEGDDEGSESEGSESDESDGGRFNQEDDVKDDVVKKEAQEMSTGKEMTAAGPLETHVELPTEAAEKEPVELTG